MALNFGSSLASLASFNGKLYAADATYGKIYVSTEGSTWLAINSSYPVTTGASPLFALAPFNGRLYAGDDNGRVYQIRPVTATLTRPADGDDDGADAGGDGPEPRQLDQLVHLRRDVAVRRDEPGDLHRRVPLGAGAAPGAVRGAGGHVDADGGWRSRRRACRPTAPSSTSSRTSPGSGRARRRCRGLPAGSSYYLQVSNNDPTFARQHRTSASRRRRSVPSIRSAPPAEHGGGVHLDLHAANATTYYWRVALTNGVLGAFGPWSSTSSFVHGRLRRRRMSGIFTSVSSTGGAWASRR